MNDELIDYARPCMMAEKALKGLHEAMLMKRYGEALQQAEEAMFQIRMTAAAVRYEQEQTKQ